MNKLPLTVPSFPLIRPDQLTARAQTLLMLWSRRFLLARWQVFD